MIRPGLADVVRRKEDPALKKADYFVQTKRPELDMITAHINLARFHAGKEKAHTKPV